MGLSQPAFLLAPIRCISVPERARGKHLTKSMRHFRVYRTFRDDRLKAGWRELFLNGDYCVQSSYEWMAAWWDHFSKRSRELLIVTIEEEGAIVGIGPFMIEHSVFISQLKFVGSGLTDYHEILADPSCGVPTISLIMEHIIKNRYADIINLEQVSDRSSLAQYLNDRGPYKKRAMVRCLKADLSFSCWEEYLQSLGRNLRRDWTKKLGHLADMGDLKFIKPATLPEKRDWLDRLLSLHARRWDREEQVSKFGAMRTKAFLARIVEEIPEIAIYVLQLDDRIVAYRMGFIHDHTYYDWNTSHDPDLSSQSVGKVLMGLVIKDLIACRVKRIDLMRGDYDWKKKWVANAQTSVNYQFLAGSSPVRGYLGERFYMEWKWWLKKQSVGLLRLPLVQKIMIKAKY